MKRFLLLVSGLVLILALCTADFSGVPSRIRTPAAANTVIALSDQGITVNGGPETDTVFTSHDIIYYEDRDTYPSGNAYGAGTLQERHSAQEAAAHTVVNITAPGTYRITGTLSAGQIRVDLGEDAFYDPKAVVTLILSDADITCSVAPAILFLNTFECDNHWKARAIPATSADTTHAGANLFIEGSNKIQGSHVAKVFKDKSKPKKLWKQDGAIESCMSMNIDGPGYLGLTGDLEGLSAALHLTIRGGDITIRAGDDGINASEEGISILTINGGFLRILSGLGSEGDGIDSNGTMIINDGTIITWSNPSDSPLDGNKIYLNGGTVIGLGADEDLIHGDSGQTTLYLTGYHFPAFESSIVVTDEDRNVLLAYDPAKDDFFSQDLRSYNAAILSCPRFSKDRSYLILMASTLSGAETHGVYLAPVLTDPGMQMINESAPDGSPYVYTYAQVSFFYLSPPSEE